MRRRKRTRREKKRQDYNSSTQSLHSYVYVISIQCCCCCCCSLYCIIIPHTFRSMILKTSGSSFCIIDKIESHGGSGGWCNVRWLSWIRERERERDFGQISSSRRAPMLGLDKEGYREQFEANRSLCSLNEYDLCETLHVCCHKQARPISYLFFQGPMPNWWSENSTRIGSWKENRQLCVVCEWMENVQQI